MRTYSQMRKRSRMFFKEHNDALPKSVNRNGRIYTPSTDERPRITNAEQRTAETLLEILFSNNRSVHNPTDIGKTWLSIFTCRIAKALGQSQRTTQRHLIKLVKAKFITERINTPAKFFMRNWVYEPTEILLNPDIIGHIKTKSIAVEYQSVKPNNIPSRRQIEPNGFTVPAHALEGTEHLKKLSSNTADAKKQVDSVCLNSEKLQCEKNTNSGAAQKFAEWAAALLWSHYATLSENQHQKLLDVFNVELPRLGIDIREACAAMRRTRNWKRLAPERAHKISRPTLYFDFTNPDAGFLRSLRIYRNTYQLANGASVRIEKERKAGKPLSIAEIFSSIK